MEVLCPVCGLYFDVTGKQEGDEVECPYCGAQLRLVRRDGNLEAEEM